MATIDYFQRKLDEKRRLTIPAELTKRAEKWLLLPAVLKIITAPLPQIGMGQTGRAQAQGDILSEEVADFRTSTGMGKLRESAGCARANRPEQHLLTTGY